jgi:hypothetical protein
MRHFVDHALKRRGSRFLFLRIGREDLLRILVEPRGIEPLTS